MTTATPVNRTIPVIRQKIPLAIPLAALSLALRALVDSLAWLACSGLGRLDLAQLCQDLPELPAVLGVVQDLQKS